MALTKVTYSMIEGVPPAPYPAFLHQTFANNYTDGVTVIKDGSVDNVHRHFGQIVEGLDGKLHLFYGRSTQHAITSGATVYYIYSNDGGATWSDEEEFVPSIAGSDQRSMSAVVTPTGRIVFIWAKTGAPSAPPTTIKLKYSDDNGVTWTSGADIVVIDYAYARTYGRIKLIPGDTASNWRLAFTPYYRSSDIPTYEVAVWYSNDNGETWAEGTPIVNDTAGYTETELTAVSSKVWFAVSRSGDGLTLWKTTNAGVNWAYVGVVPQTSSDSQVAPCLDKFYKNGKWYLLLGYINRGADKAIFRICDAESALTTTALFGGEMVTATDMLNASGYQSTVVKSNGVVYFEEGTAFVVFKEFTAQTYSIARFQIADFEALAKSTFRFTTVASGAVTIPDSDFDYQIGLNTEGSAALDDLDTINGGSENQILTVRGNGATSTRDVILRSGTGNLILKQDYRINLLSDSRITLIYQNGFWYELARTYDDAVQQYTILSGAITVPTATAYSLVFIVSEGGGATDDLNTINGGIDGQLMTFITTTSAQDITFKNNVDNLRLAGDFTLDTSLKTITLVKRGSIWYETCRSSNV